MGSFCMKGWDTRAEEIPVAILRAKLCVCDANCAPGNRTDMSWQAASTCQPNVYLYCTICNLFGDTHAICFSFTHLMYSFSQPS